jgi:GNAT superfamily N-acetyltransferase
VPRDPAAVDEKRDGDGDADEEEGEEEVAAMALFFANYSTWRAAPGVYLEDLYVRPAHRRRGHAAALLAALAGEARAAGGDAARLEWACLRWNEGALAAYEAAGAVRMDGWVGLRVEGEGLRRLAEKGV